MISTGSSVNGRSSRLPATRSTSRSTAACSTSFASRVFRPHQRSCSWSATSTGARRDRRRSGSMPRHCGRSCARRKRVRDSLAGVTIDFEDIPEDLRGSALQFAAALRVALNPIKRIVTAAVPSYTTTRELQRIAAVTDYVIAMLFDEHYAGGAPGPVASQQFYTDRARD